MVMVHQVYTYADLRKQIHEDLRIQHPEWIQPNGRRYAIPYEARLMKTLQSLNQGEHNSSSGRGRDQLEQRQI
ncbi:MAG TPA: hypothetical protein VIU10_02290 [Candidatus Udaeobacter sp.]